MRPKLVLVAGKADKAEIRLKLPTIVGRTHDAGLMIAHKTVSRRHCELFERHGMLFVRDTGSRNGTLVDSAPIKKEAMVKPGHTLTIGPLT
ncbi:MAG TPA: FHA domain-containing protein, partial [Lacipirellulaceae bacterium]|nr:FHA domain-containing protein [Lacipirellulaceae bacterium]